MLQDITHIDLTLDEQLKEITKLNWLPWIGRDYKMNKYSDRLLVVGESHYDWREYDSLTKLQNRDFTRFVIEEQGLSHLSNWQQKEREWYWRLVRNLEKTFFNEQFIDSNKRERLWHSVAFFNLVQRYLETNKHRPTKIDYVEGWQVFFELVKIIQPNQCIILGTENNKIAGLNLALKDSLYYPATVSWGKKIGKSYSKSIYLKSEALPELKILFIKHPSSFFNWKEWAKILEQEIPIFTSQLRINQL